MSTYFVDKLKYDVSNEANIDVLTKDTKYSLKSMLY